MSPISTTISFMPLGNQAPKIRCSARPLWRPMAWRPPLPVARLLATSSVPDTNSAAIKVLGSGVPCTLFKGASEVRDAAENAHYLACEQSHKPHF